LEVGVDALTSARYHLFDTLFARLGIENPALMRILKELPRHAFLESALHGKAYADTALPIGLDQTISQPSTVAWMTHCLEPRAGDKILEIGTGSGYQAAVLAKFTHRLYTVERIPDLSRRAQGILERLGFRNIIFKIGDGSIGWESWAPYDRIIVTAGAPVMGDRLRKQLAEGGRLILPTGERSRQRLLQVVRHGDEYEETDLGECRFVPLIGSEGFKA
jgi:protein-L-isoaspartate(D-aspartate) O-methyltransferase